jgi:hypothetical protein
MRGFVDTLGLDRILLRLDQYRPQRADWRDLAEDLETVVVEDNRRGVLQGQDRHGNALAPVRYRTGFGVRTRFRQTSSATFGTLRKRFQGLGGGNGNLTTGQYRQLTGPPLAPRRDCSRVITNLNTRHRMFEGGIEVEGAWVDVASAKGVPFLRFHFRGSGRLAKRDLRGVRPAGMELALKLTREWHRRIRWRRAA